MQIRSSTSSSTSMSDPREIRITATKPDVFASLDQPARYKGAWGGRGSGKSHYFAQALVLECFSYPGTRAVCIREYQRTLQQSSKALVEATIRRLGLISSFRILHDRIETPGGGVIIFAGMRDHTAESIKSLEGCRRAWIEEAQTLTERSLKLLTPTIREPNAEIWASWNPRHRTDAIDKFLRGNPPDNAIVVRANYSDNPWFPTGLEADRLYDERHSGAHYRHVWEGDYMQVFEGAYFADDLAMADKDGRIGEVRADPNLSLRAFWDIGGAGARADATAIWVVQFISQEIRVLDYIELKGQKVGDVLAELRHRGWEKAICHLPHDGSNANNVTGKTYEDHIREAGLSTTVTRNAGAVAARRRIEAVRRLFPKMWFNLTPTESGRLALGYYHPKRDETRNVDLGPEHDWSSHAADAFGLMAISYEEPSKTSNFNRAIEYPKYGVI